MPELSVSRVQAACLGLLLGLSTIVLAACSDLTTPTSDHRITVSGPRTSFAKEVDWWQCTSWDGGSSWTCEYTGTESYGDDYWLPDRGVLITKSNCADVISVYCDQTLRSGPSNQPFGTEEPNETQQDMAALAQTPPDCTHPRNTKERAYCTGVDPSGVRLDRLNAVLARMDSLGGECAALAAVGRRLVADRHIRIYVNSAFPAFSGAAPLDGSNTNPAVNEWMVLSDAWFDSFYDASHHTTFPHDLYAPRNLEQVLAHEADHLVGREHVGTDGSQTPNSQSCSGLSQ
jgi:hypothetical protein